jgi:quinol monooxygenase YgiN
MQKQMRRVRKVALTVILGLAAMAMGCASYYVVTDLKRDKTYYTTEFHRASGTLRFIDAKTGATITIQESEIREVSEKEFQANTVKYKTSP